MHDAAPRPREVLGRPGLLLAILTLALNDHVLKAAAPGALTGKLSDAAGLFAAPLVAWAAADLAARRPLGDASLRLLAGATAAAFALLKVCAPAREAYLDAYAGAGLPAAVAPDGTDLLCLPAALLACLYGRAHLAAGAAGHARPPRRLAPPRLAASGGAARLPAALRAAVVACFAFLTVATSVQPQVLPVEVVVTHEAAPGRVRLDARAYVDRPLEVELPGGRLASARVVARVTPPWTRGAAVAPVPSTALVRVVWELAPGDPVAEGDPLRLPLPAGLWRLGRREAVEQAVPLAEAPGLHEHRLTAVYDDGRTVELDFRLEGGDAW